MNDYNRVWEEPCVIGVDCVALGQAVLGRSLPASLKKGRWKEEIKN